MPLMCTEQGQGVTARCPRDTVGGGGPTAEGMLTGPPAHPLVRARRSR
jgi:hypothetical protein